MLSDNYCPMSTLNAFATIQPSLTFSPAKKKIATRRIQKLIEQLMQFNFSIYYLPGTKMHIADMLSRLAGKDLDPPDKVIPISFNAMQSSQPRRCSPRIKKQAIQTPSPAGKVDHTLSAYQPQVLLKRLPEVLNKDTHISKDRHLS